MNEFIKNNRVTLLIILGVSLALLPLGFLLTRSASEKPAEPSEETVSVPKVEPLRPVRSAIMLPSEFVEEEETAPPTVVEPVATTDALPEKVESEDETAIVETERPFALLPDSPFVTADASNAPSVGKSGDIDVVTPITIRNLPLDVPLIDTRPELAEPVIVLEPTKESAKAEPEKAPPSVPRTPPPTWPPVVVQNVFPQTSMTPPAYPMNYPMAVPMPMPVYPMMPMMQPVRMVTFTPVTFYTVQPGRTMVIVPNRGAPMYFVQ